MRLREVAGRTTSSGLGIVAASAAAFLLTLGLSRLLSPALFGAVAVALTWATIGSQVAQMGFLRASTKIVATTRAAEDPATLKSFLLFAFGVATIGSLLGAALFVWVIPADELVENPAIPVGALVAALVWPMAICRVASGVLLGERRNFLGSFAQTGLPSLGILGGFLVFALLPGSEDGSGISRALAGGAFAAAAIGLGLVAWQARDAWQAKRAGFRPREWLALSLPLMIVGLLQVMNRQISVVVLGSISGPEAVAAYYPASRISDFATLGLLGINAALAPHIAVMFREGRKEQLQATLTKAAAISFASTGAIVLAGLVLAAPLLGLFGGVAGEGAAALRILLAAQLLVAATGSVGVVTAMAGQERFAAATAFVVLALNYAMLQVLVPGLTTVGAALATAAAAVIWNLALLARCYRTLGLDPSVLALRFSHARSVLARLRR